MTPQEMTFEINSQKIAMNSRVKLYLQNGKIEDVILAKNEVCFKKDENDNITECWLEIRRHYIVGLNPSIFKTFPIQVKDIFKIVSTPLRSRKEGSVTTIYAEDSFQTRHGYFDKFVS